MYEDYSEIPMSVTFMTKIESYGLLTTNFNHDTHEMQWNDNMQTENRAYLLTEADL